MGGGGDGMSWGFLSMLVKKAKEGANGKSPSVFYSDWYLGAIEKSRRAISGGFDDTFNGVFQSQCLR